MKECILLSHVFIDKTLSDHEEVIEKVQFSIKHTRKNNPRAYIILTGHGLKPNGLEQYCDFIHWEENIIKTEINFGHPKLVNIGLKHANDLGFEYILKTRADSIHLIENIFKFCQNKLGSKQYLITQKTTLNPDNLGDLFLFGKTEFFLKCWNIQKWEYKISGLEPHAKNFIHASECEIFEDALLKNAVIVDIINLKWICLRAPNNWSKLKLRKKRLLENKLFNSRKYLWGTSEGHFVWRRDLKLKNLTNRILTEENFYSVLEKSNGSIKR